MFYTGYGKTPCSNFLRWYERPTQRFTVKQLCQTCVLAVPQTIKVSLTKAGNQAKPLKYSGGRSCISYQLADVQTYSHRPDTKPTTTQQRLTCAPKYAWWGCCCLKDTGSKNLFRINISLPFTSLDWMGQACGFASQVTGPHTNALFPMTLHGSLDLNIDSQSWRGTYSLFIEAAATIR